MQRKVKLLVLEVILVLALEEWHILSGSAGISLYSVPQLDIFEIAVPSRVRVSIQRVIFFNIDCDFSCHCCYFLLLLHFLSLLSHDFPPHSST